MKHHEYITDERIIENLKVYRRENFLRKFNLMTISILYSVIMICIIAMIYGSQQQKMTSNVTISYIRPYYTVSFDPQGGGVSPSSKQVKFGDNYGDLPTPTKTGYSFRGWSLEIPDSYPEYIESSGTQYIDTGFVANGGMVAEYKAMYLYNEGYIVGSHSVSYPYGRNGCWLRADGKWEMGYGDTYPTGGFGSLNTIYTVKLSTLYDDAYVEVDGTRIISTSGQNVSTDNVYLLTNTYNIALGADRQARARVYYVKIWDSSGNLVRDYVPYINSQGEVGMLDKANDKFYGNDGIGAFFANVVTSTTKLTTLGDHTLTANWAVNTYTVTLIDDILNAGVTGTKTGIGYNNMTVTYTSSYYQLHNTGTSDPFGSLSHTITLTAGTTYTASATIRNGTSSSGALASGGSIQIFYAINYGYNEPQSVRLTNGSSATFSVSTSGTYNVRLDNDYGVDVTLWNLCIGTATTKTVIYDQIPSSISVPSRSGYYFGGYFTGTGGSGTQYFGLTGAAAYAWDIASNTTLYACWISSSSSATLSSDWKTLLSLTASSVKSIVFTSNSSATSGFTNGMNVGTNVTAYYNSDKANIVIYSPYVIRIPSYNYSIYASMFFSGFSSLTTLKLDNIDTQNVIAMTDMFYGCSSLTKLNVSNLNTNNLITTSSMFHGCSKLTNLNVSNFNTEKVTNMANMFNGCSSLTSLNLGSNFYTEKVTTAANMFRDCSKLTSLNLGSNFNTKELSNMGGMFYGCSSLKSLDVSNFNTQNTIYMDNMFNGCSSLTNLDVTSFNTSEVTSMERMFSGCSSLTNLNVSNFITGEVTTMLNMFYNCSSLTSLNVSGFNTEKVTNMSGMFYDCSSLKSLDVSNFITQNTIYMVNMFYNCSSLTSLNVSGFNTEKVTNMLDMFCDCSSLTSLDVTHFNTEKVTNMAFMFKGCSKLTSLNLSSFNTAKVTSMSSMFSNCSSLTSLNVSNFDTSNVQQYMNYMFYNCKSLTSLDVTHFNTEKVTNMAFMFYGCRELTTLDVSNFNTENVINMGGMFSNCSSLTSLNVSNFNTEKVTNMASMFNGCASLTSLNLSSFNTQKVTNMYGMFSNCSSLTSLDVTHFNTSGVTKMGYMFYNCSGLTSLNLGSFNLSVCNNFTDMLTGCSALTSITLPYNLGSSYTITLPTSTFYNGTAGPYSTVGSATSGTTVACSTESSKVTLTKK